MKMLITGTPNVMKDSMIKLAVERAKGKVKFNLLAFSDFIEKPYEDTTLEITSFKYIQKNIAKTVQLKLLKYDTESKRNIIVNGYTTVKTNIGYLPIITEKVIKVMKPDVIVHLEVDRHTLIEKDIDSNEFRIQQSVDNIYAITLANMSVALLKVIKSERDNTRKVSEELAAFIREFFGG